MKILLPGIVLVAISWFVAWTHTPIIGEHYFFPLWLGYILTINGLNSWFFGDSLLKRMGWSFVLLFVLSAPMWWIFEYLNTIVHNWYYIFPHPISNLEYFIRASISFSTVIPAVLSTGLMFQHIFKKFSFQFRPIKISHPALLFTMLLGVLCIHLVIFFPKEAFPLVWIAPVLFIEPILYFKSKLSVLRFIERGEWLVPISFVTGTLFAGFWWELWNFYSMPKWIYTVPYVDFWHIFEMPVLGYGGYLPFGLILYSFTVLIYTLLKMRSNYFVL